MITQAQRDHFDLLVERVIEVLPGAVRRAMDEVPIVVLDQPEPDMLRDLGIDPAEDDGLDICGLHTGTMLTERSHAEHPDERLEVVHLFRIGIVLVAGGWKRGDRLHIELLADGADFEPIGSGGDDAIAEQIRVTILHEFGHHFGLDEDRLGELGYD